MTSKLTPVDYNRCQAEIKEGSFMTLGPRGFGRCPSKATWIAMEKEPDQDGQVGAMSLCDNCKEAFEAINGTEAAIIKRIGEECH